MALARYIVMLFRVLHRKGHKKLAVDGNDVERGIGIRQLWIDKRWRRGHGGKIDIISLHHAASEIGDIQAGHAILILCDGEALCVPPKKFLILFIACGLKWGPDLRGAPPIWAAENRGRYDRSQIVYSSEPT